MSRKSIKRRNGSVIEVDTVNAIEADAELIAKSTPARNSVHHRRAAEIMLRLGIAPERVEAHFGYKPNRLPTYPDAAAEQNETDNRPLKPFK